MPIDHKSVCQGHYKCSKCGRRICGGCSGAYIGVRYVTCGEIEEVHNYRDSLVCLICSGMYKIEDINLWPAEDKDWDI